MVEAHEAWSSGRRACLPMSVIELVPDELQPADLAVLLHLSALAWSRSIYPGHATLSRRTGLPVSLIRRALARAEDAGVLSTTSRGRGRSLRVVLHLPARGEQPSPAYPAHHEQPTLPTGGRYPAPCEQTSLTAVPQRTAVVVNGALGVPLPGRLAEEFARQNAMDTAKHLVRLIDPTADVSAWPNQLASCTPDAIERARDALARQRDRVRKPAAFVVAMARAFSDDAAAGGEDAPAAPKRAAAVD